MSFLSILEGVPENVWKIEIFLKDFNFLAIFPSIFVQN